MNPAETSPAAPGVPAAQPFHVAMPATWQSPVVFASPHSGRAYPAAFVATSRLDPIALRRSEDAFVDELFAAAPELGAPLLRAHFPRAYVDPNRERLELDRTMFDGPLPAGANSRSPRVLAGLGTLARVVTNGEEIYTRRLPVAEIEARLSSCYDPYHAALEELLQQAESRFGRVLLVDCHSMPSIGGPMDQDSGDSRVDVVLGDRWGSSCAVALSDLAEHACRAEGLLVRRNTPYAGGFTTVYHGRPDEGRHALQIEINRALYMDEDRITKTAQFPTLANQIRRVIADLINHAPAILSE